MFFEIKKSYDSTFTQSHQLNNNFWLNCDAGWSKFVTGDVTVYIKGYIDTRAIDINLINDIVQDPVPKYRGNFLAVIVFPERIILTHDINRSTPIKINQSNTSVHNLNKDYTKEVWADHLLEISSDVNLIKFDPLGISEFRTLSMDVVLDKLDKIFLDKITQFANHNTLPIKFFPSGGVDNFLILSYLNKLGIEYEMCNFEHIDLTKFVCYYKENYQQYWGYRQIHHWKEPCVLVSGGNGDENLLRGPFTANLLCQHYGLNLLEILDPRDYHYNYFSSEKNKMIYTDQKQNKLLQSLIPHKSKLFKYILTNILNDHQHWHLENTITFTPFKDIELTKSVLQLDITDLTKQFKNAEINRELIKRNDPNLLNYICEQKNIREKENVWKLFK